MNRSARASLKIQSVGISRYWKVIKFQKKHNFLRAMIKYNMEAIIQEIKLYQVEAIANRRAKPVSGGLERAQVVSFGRI